MAYPTLAQVLDAIEGKLSAATGLAASQSYDELTEGIADTPLLQVYPQAWEPDDANGARSLRSQRVEHLTVHADVYATQRSELSEDMAAVVTYAQAVVTVLRAQDAPNQLFELSGILRWTWRGERMSVEVPSGSGTWYEGMRFVLEVWMHS